MKVDLISIKLSDGELIPIDGVIADYTVTQPTVLKKLLSKVITLQQPPIVKMTLTNLPQLLQTSKQITIFFSNDEETKCLTGLIENVQLTTVTVRF